MMETTRLLCALALTWLPGCIWIMRLVPQGVTGRAYLIAGYGTLSGLIVVPVIMRGLSLIGVPFSLLSIGLPMILLAIAGLGLPGTRRAGSAAPLPSPMMPRSIHPLTPGRWETLVIYLCLALIVARLLTLGFELGLRPVFAWDAKQHWAKQAKIFFETGSIVQYVPFREWLESAGSKVYTTVHPDYPITVPLLQAWTSVAIGEWHDSLVNLPWLLCYVSLGLIFFGQLRAAGASNVLAIAPTYMLLSLPYLNIQVALAGYADIILATCYLAATAAFFNWTINRSRAQAVLAIFFALSCPLIKNEGVFWLLSFIPGLLLVMLGLKRGMVSLAVLFVVVLLCLWLLPQDLIIAGHSLAKIDLQYRPESWPNIYKSFLVHDNWHLLSYLIAAMALAMATLSATARQRIAPLAAVVTAAMCLHLALYLLTRNAHGAVLLTSINRVALQLIPALGFWASITLLELVRDKPAPAGGSG